MDHTTKSFKYKFTHEDVTRNYIIMSGRHTGWGLARMIRTAFKLLYFATRPQKVGDPDYAGNYIKELRLEILTQKRNYHGTESTNNSS